MTLSKMMTRIIAIGKLESYEYKETPFVHGKGVLDVGNGKVRFTIFNSSETAQNQHTRATDFNEQFKKDDLVFLSGQDNRSYSDEKETHYEDVNVWDFRAAEEDETHRWVFVYIGDIKELDEETGMGILSFVNYKDVEIDFHFNLMNLKGELPEDCEVGARVKMKGEIFNGLVLDYFGDGEFVTERRPVMVEVLNTAEEVEEENSADEDADAEDGAMWT
jgi:hypothetical protein